MRSYFLLAALILGGSNFLFANNIQVSNVQVSEDIPTDTYIIEFDITWENSWRTSSFEANHDAAWIFLKWKSDDSPEWSHLSQGFVDEPGEVPSGAEMIFPADGTGFFIQRDADGIGDVLFENVSLMWDDGIKEGFEVCVYAIEMVFIPEGPFQVGDGTDQVSVFESGNSGDPFTIASEGEINLGGTALSSLSNHDFTVDDYYLADDFNYGTTQLVPESFPKGYDAFYMMKYEVSQGQYAAFLSSLTPDQADLRYPDFYGEHGFTIAQIGSPNIYKADLPERAVNYINWVDLAWYADWSGLRPMSELEYEKACRGPETPVAGEFAWGSIRTIWASYSVEELGTKTERISNPERGAGNVMNYGSALNIGGPFTCGWAAAVIDNPTREEAGASYYGAMEMTGNAAELVLSVGTPEGRVFDGSIHGDGTVSELGVLSWPAMTDENGDEIGQGSAWKGGTWTTYPSEAFVSRRYAVNNNYLPRSRGFGGRFVRSNF